MANPYTDTCRPVADLLQTAVDACFAAQVRVVRVYHGTTLKGLAREAATALTESQGEPAAVVLYAGSQFDRFPRRTSVVDVVLLSGDTRVTDGQSAAVAAARAVAAQLDDAIHEDLSGESPLTDKWEAASEEAVDLPGLASAAAIRLSFTVKDY